MAIVFDIILRENVLFCPPYKYIAHVSMSVSQLSQRGQFLWIHERTYNDFYISYRDFNFFLYDAVPPPPLTYILKKIQGLA